MPIEVKGQQLRIRVQSPSKFSKFRTQDVGSVGKLQRVAGYSKKLGWQTQSWRLNLNDYKNFEEIKKEIQELNIPESKKKKAIQVSKKYMESN